MTTHTFELFSAFSTADIKFVVVKQKFRAVFFADLVLKLFDLLAVVLDHLAAADTKDVVVVAFDA